MFIVFQYPIVDYRILIEKNYKLTKPHWPNPEIGEMQKFTGCIVDRTTGDAPFWSGDEKYCTAEKAIKFVDLQSNKFKLENNTDLFIEGVKGSRFFHSDGKFMSSYEIGLQRNAEDYLQHIDVKENFFENYLSHICKIKLKIKNPPGQDLITDIGNCGDYLENLYLYSTSELKKNKNNEIEKWWVSKGDSVCIVEYIDYENEIKLPAGATKVHSYRDKGITLYKYAIDLSRGSKIKTWLIKIQSVYYDVSFCRLLELNLLRINSEKEAYRKMVTILQDKGGSLINIEGKNSEYFKCLEKFSTNLFKEKRYGVVQKDIIDLAVESEDKPNPLINEYYGKNLKPFKNDLIIGNHKRLTKKNLNVQDSEKQRPFLFYITTIIATILFLFVVSFGGIIIPAANYKFTVFGVLILYIVFVLFMARVTNIISVGILKALLFKLFPTLKFPFGGSK